jgi:hypothetical protein
MRGVGKAEVSERVAEQEVAEVIGYARDGNGKTGEQREAQYDGHGREKNHAGNGAARQTSCAVEERRAREYGAHQKQGKRKLE